MPVQVERLEHRTLLKLTSVSYTQLTLVLISDDTPTQVTVRLEGPNVVIREDPSGINSIYRVEDIDRIEFYGGSAADHFMNFASGISLQVFAGAGDDIVDGGPADDFLDGGAGDDILRGFDGDDLLIGGSGNDLLLGFAGDDTLWGGDGNDQLNGHEGLDALWGEQGNDVLIALDEVAFDQCDGGAGADTYWIDQTRTGKDKVARENHQGDEIRAISHFANGADRSLDGDRLWDPELGSPEHVYSAFTTNPLYSKQGPVLNDIKQNALGDCWLLAGLGAIAKSYPDLIRRSVVDFNDGTYGVQLGNCVYRVDSDLPVLASDVFTPVFAQLGADASLWVAIVEKAYAFHRAESDAYQVLEQGWSTEVNRSFGLTPAKFRAISRFASTEKVCNRLVKIIADGFPVTLGVTTPSKKSVAHSQALAENHMYTLVAVQSDTNGDLTQIVVRNPWGFDGQSGSGDPDDGLITVSINELSRMKGRFNWARAHQERPIVLSRSARNSLQSR